MAWGQRPPEQRAAKQRRTAPRPRTPVRDALAANIRGELGFLASDALQGRESGTRDELLAAEYIGSELRQAGVQPAGDDGSYIQNVAGEFRIRGNATKPWKTRNVIGTIPGSDPVLKNEAILLTAHMDHVGVREPVNGDSIYNGADDDASGCVAILELARFLAEKPGKRTVIIAFFGSEETGGQGNEYFLTHPPVPLDRIVTNLEFEMIGRPDAAVKPGEIWLTGFDRSDLGFELARHGARLVADPHPEMDFFARSDNYALAIKGIVAHTVSSYGLHQDYHRPSDDLAHIDFRHMEEVIRSMLQPVEWLANSSFKPQWKAGQKPH